jgi:hypothetical protein
MPKKKMTAEKKRIETAKEAPKSKLETAKPAYRNAEEELADTLRSTRSGPNKNLHGENERTLSKSVVQNPLRAGKRQAYDRPDTKKKKKITPSAPKGDAKKVAPAKPAPTPEAKKESSLVEKFKSVVGAAKEKLSEIKSAPIESAEDKAKKEQEARTKLLQKNKNKVNAGNKK